MYRRERVARVAAALAPAVAASAERRSLGTVREARDLALPVAAVSAAAWELAAEVEAGSAVLGGVGE